MALVNSIRQTKNRLRAQAIIGTILAMALAFGVYWLGTEIGRLPDSTRTALITGCATVIASVLTVALTRLRERQIALEKDQQERRIPVYGEFLDSFQEYMASPEEVRKRKQAFGPFPPAMLVWGSDEVVRCWSHMKEVLRAEEVFTPTGMRRFMLAFGDLLLAMRRDLGYSNSGISNEAIVRIFTKEDGGNDQPKLTEEQLAELVSRIIAEKSNQGQMPQ
jgi:hypothetical protein